MPTSGAVVAGRDGAGTAGPTAGFSPGLAFLLSGRPQWLWGQRGAGLCCSGRSLGAAGAGAFAWGTGPGP